MNNVIDGELVAQGGSTEDVAPDVFVFWGIGDGRANLCLLCAIKRTRKGADWLETMGQLVDDVCEDCDNDG